MSRPVIALLLNAFLLPGMGQIYLGKKIKGIAIILSINLLLLPALFLLMKIASPIIGAHMTGNPVTATQILSIVQPYSVWAKVLIFAFVALWGYSLLDITKEMRAPSK